MNLREIPYQKKTPRLLIKDASEQDLQQVADIEKTNFADPWTYGGFADALGLEHVIFKVAQLEVTAHDFIDATTRGNSGSDKKIVVGYGVLYLMADEGEIPTISVTRDARHNGVADALLHAMMEEAAQRGAGSIFLEVRPSNEGALALYEKWGFVSVGMRKGFYQHPVEDAIVMKKELQL